MTNVGATDYAGLLCKEDLCASEMLALRRAARSSRETKTAVREVAARLEGGRPAGKDRAALAICYWVEGDSLKALELAGQEKESEAAQFVAARCLLALDRPSEAAAVLKPVAAKSKSGEVHAALAEALRKNGDRSAAASAAREALAKCGQCAAVHVEAGILADMEGDSETARRHYEEALKRDAECAEALFRLAYVADLRGDNEASVDFYRRCVQVRPVRSRALLNLGLLYEEMGRDAEAAACFRLVNDKNPMDPRARLYLRDADASKDMYFDEEQQKRRDRRDKILETAITEFELSVRSRNCLEKMNVTTVGDLCRITETELLMFKNFGETSLNEIKAMMASKGLRLGQSIEEDSRSVQKAKPPRKKPADQSKMLSRSVDELGLSVRSQHCMLVLGIKTIGDLAGRNEKRLMEAKNFGATSLAEIRKKLAAVGLTLAE